MPRQGTIPRICLQCGEPFLARTRQIVHGDGHYCSKGCATRARHARERIPVAERFWTKVERADDDSCWSWQGHRNADGYGAFRIGEGLTSAHRFAWELSAGSIPDGMLVCHTCDNPACVRNDDDGWYEIDGILHPRRGHLWLGTDADNNRDKALKKRAAHLVGEKHGYAKLTDEAVRDIRFRIARHESLTSISHMYSVDISTISHVRDGKTWKHVI